MKKIIVICCSLFCISATEHPIHISFTRIEVSNTKLIVLTKIFSDDLYTSMKQVTSCNDCSVNDMQKYIQSVLKIKNNTHDVNFQLDSFKIKDKAHWVYLHANFTTKPQNVQVTNSILCNLYDDQKNLCIFIANDSEQGYNFDFENRLHSFSCN